MALPEHGKPFEHDPEGLDRAMLLKFLPPSKNIS
jgi:hypothetical protein